MPGIAERPRETDASWAERTRRQELNRARYEPERVAARLSLLEFEARKTVFAGEIDQLRSGAAYPAMPPARRTLRLSEMEKTLTELQTPIVKVVERVSDPESVVNADGSLPYERREASLNCFRFQRQSELKRLRGLAAEIAESLEASRDRSERIALRRKLYGSSLVLKLWIEISPLTAPKMCSEFPYPAQRHIHRTGSPNGITPCPAWPRWAERLRNVVDQLDRLSPPRPVTPKVPEVRPLAIIQSRLPIAEVLKRLAEIQVSYPDPEVRRGSRNRWEVWPSTPSQKTRSRSQPRNH